jgi:epoxyqueuosine reductase
MTNNDNYSILALSIKAWGKELGFSDVCITDVNLSEYEAGLSAWLAAGHHGEMAYMEAHGMKRARPAELVPNAVRAIMVRMDYVPVSDWRDSEKQRINNAEQAVISIYARGRDYHKVLRSRLQELAKRIEIEIGAFGYRVFTDSAPVMEVALAEKAGLGWRGKHTLLLNQHAGSTFFIGEIITDLPLPVDSPSTPLCGTCSACITCCPTQAILAPYELDARRCISYLTIELKGSIPLELRPLIGNRVYGCDDCQVYCPWNKFAQVSEQADFAVRNGLDNSTLVELFNWSEEEFMEKLQGSPIRRIGYERWLRNLAVGLGNARRKLILLNLDTREIDLVLQEKLSYPSDLVREHVLWALSRGRVD